MTEQALDSTRLWLRDFLAKSHPRLGRKGEVCPFVRRALEQDLIEIKVISEALDADSMRRCLHREMQLHLDKIRGHEGKMRSTLGVTILVYPRGRDQRHAALMDQVQASMKVSFMQQGLMIGQFHPFQQTPALNNPAFKPHAAPTFFFAIRKLIKSDHIFVHQSLDGQGDRVAASEAYRKHFTSQGITSCPIQSSSNMPPRRPSRPPHALSISTSRTAEPMCPSRSETR